MSLRNHRIAAISIVAAEIVVLFAWGRSMGNDSADVRAIRDKLQGSWVASLVQAGDHRKAEGPAGSGCRVEFDGKSVVFHGLIGDIDARGTYYIEPSAHPDWVDFKLDAGWIVGIYEVDGDTLKVAMNAFALPERLGVPTQFRPRKLHGGDGRHYYVFRKAMPGS
jgi:uncharacterized protein (TIGR03067 family)